MNLTDKQIIIFKHWVRKQHDLAGQRRVDGTPYWNHTERVADLVAEFGQNHLRNNIMYLSALAHDVIEDTEADWDELGELIGMDVQIMWLVSDIKSHVNEVTNEFTKESYPFFNRSKRKELESKRLGSISLIAKQIKLADIIDNLSDVKTSKPEMAETYFKEKANVLAEMVLHDRTITTYKLFHMAKELITKNLSCKPIILL